MPIVHVTTMANGLNDQDIFFFVPGNDRPVVSCPELVIWIPGEWIQPMLGPFSGLVNLVHYPGGNVILYISQLFNCRLCILYLCHPN